MSLKKLLKKLKSYLDKDAELLEKKDEGLSKVLKKLKQKEKKIKRKIAEETDEEELELLELSLKVVHTQRKKGSELLSSLRKKEK